MHSKTKLGADVLNTIRRSTSPRRVNPIEALERRALLTASISGIVFHDITGNGMSADDTPLAGQVVKLYKDVNGNGILDATDGASIASKTSGANGAYSFTGLALGKYIVADAPVNAVRTGPATSNIYAVNANANANFAGKNFDNYLETFVRSRVTGISYLINGITTVTELMGNVHQGDTVQVNFTITAGPAVVLSLKSYDAPGPTFSYGTASKQTLFQSATGTFGPGQHSMTVTVPDCYFQIDFVGGLVIDRFGPATSNIFDNRQGRQIDGATGGTSECVEDAYITIAPDATNVVGADHTFTATVFENDDAGMTFHPVGAGTKVTEVLTASNGALIMPVSPAPTSSTATTDTYVLTTNASGQVSVTFTSPNAGKVVGSATVSLTLDDGTVTRTTGDGHVPADNGGVGDGPKATKFFEDEYVTIGPGATNGITDPHTFTTTVFLNKGDGTGFHAAGAGTTVTEVLTSSNGASITPLSPVPTSTTVTTDTYILTTNSSGQVAVTFTSPSAGTVIGNATTSLTLNGVTITRTTGDNYLPANNGGIGDSPNATKLFVAGTLEWLKEDMSNMLLGGATFVVKRTLDDQGNAVSDPAITVTDNMAPDADPTAGQFELDKLLLGTYTIVETLPPTGYMLDTHTATVVLTTTIPSDSSAIPVFHDAMNPAGSGATATIGFWHNKNGQGLINNAGTTTVGGLTLANWLATNFPNMFGTTAPAFSTLNTGPVHFVNLANQPNSSVASAFLTFFGVTGPKTYAQVMCTALSVFFGDPNLGQNSSSKGFGFTGTVGGTLINIGSDGAAFGVANNTSITVDQMLTAANNDVASGVIDSSDFIMVNDQFDAVNQSFDIG